MAKASIGVKSAPLVEDAHLHADAVSLFFQAVADCGMSDKEAAYTMALDPAQLSRVKSHQARLPLDAMWRLPDAFWLAFNARVIEVRQLTPETKSAINRKRIVELVDLLLQETA